MADDDRIEARLVLKNGAAFNVAVPVDLESYAVWLKCIEADRFAVFGRDLVVRTDAIAFIVRGSLLEDAKAGMAMPMPTGRMN